MSSLSVADFLVTISLKIRTEARNPFAPPQRNSEITCRHQAGFYSDDGFLLDDVAHFIGTALDAGNAALVVATELHRNSLLPKLEAQGVDTATAIEQGDTSRWMLPTRSRHS